MARLGVGLAIVSALLASVCASAQADSGPPVYPNIVTFMSGPTTIPGDQSSLSLCSDFFEGSCLPGDTLATLGPFTETGQPEQYIIPATDPNAAAIIAYLDGTNPGGLDAALIASTTGEGSDISEGFTGITRGIPITELVVDDTGNMVNYQMVGIGIAPEPPELATLFIGLGALVALRWRGKAWRDREIANN
jgi:hypothetical protein